ncbi:MAG: hypothetical protein RBJ76_00755 [Stenomitos frigidus ULC029]
MTTFPQPQTNNRFPRCVALQLHLESKASATVETAAADPFALPPNPAADNGKSPYPPLAMSLTINFSGEQTMDIPGAKVLGIPSGKATFGVTRCQLDFTLTDCRLPLDEVALSAPFKRSVTVETQQERATEAQVGATLGGTVGEKTSGTGSGTVGYKQSGKTVEKVTTERFQVHFTGDEDCPTWIFEVKDGNPVLQGSLTREKLGTVSLDQLPEKKPQNTLAESALIERSSPKATRPDFVIMERHKIVADLSVRAEDVRLTWGKYALTPNITRNKLALIERAIALKHIAPQLKDGLCKTEWHHG